MHYTQNNIQMEHFWRRTEHDSVEDKATFPDDLPWPTLLDQLFELH